MFIARAISSENEEECLLDQLGSSSACVTDRSRIEKRLHYSNCSVPLDVAVFDVEKARCGNRLFGLPFDFLCIENGFVSLANECVVKALLTHFLSASY